MYWYRGVRCKMCKDMIGLKELEGRYEQFEADMSQLIQFTVACPHCLEESLYAREDLEAFPSENRVKSEWKM